LITGAVVIRWIFRPQKNDHLLMRGASQRQWRPGQPGGDLLVAGNGFSMPALVRSWSTSARKPGRDVTRSLEMPLAQRTRSSEWSSGNRPIVRLDGPHRPEPRGVPKRDWRKPYDRHFAAI